MILLHPVPGDPQTSVELGTSPEGGCGLPVSCSGGRVRDDPCYVTLFGKECLRYPQNLSAGKIPLCPCHTSRKISETFSLTNFCRRRHTNTWTYFILRSPSLLSLDKISLFTKGLEDILTRPEVEYIVSKRKDLPLVELERFRRLPRFKETHHFTVCLPLFTSP